jgi:DNA-binding CsgD family transcriptional regulator
VNTTPHPSATEPSPACGALVAEVVAASERLCRLYLVPSQDWLDKAASALAMRPLSAGVALVLCDVSPRGIITTIHASGAWPTRATHSPPLGTTVLNSALASKTAHELRMHLASLAGHHWLGAGATDRPKGESAAAPAPVSPLSVSHNAVWKAFGGGQGIGALSPLSPGAARSLVSYLIPCLGTQPPAELAYCWGATSALAARLAHRAFANNDLQAAEHWLSPREQEVLESLLAGMSVPEIASLQRRSVHTVHDYVKRLHAKLGARTRGELIVRALGFDISPQDPQRADEEKPEPIKVGPHG